MKKSQNTYVNAPRYLLRKNCALRLLKGIPVGKALEIGCGAGDFSATIYQKGFSVLSVDISQEAVELCEHRLSEILLKPDFNIKNSDFMELNDQFDIIFMFEVLEHIEDDKAALDKIFQLLKPGGHLLLSVPANQKWFGASDEYFGHFRRYDKKDLTKIFKQCHFEITDLWSYGIPLGNLTDYVRDLIYTKKKTASKEEGTKKSGIDRKYLKNFGLLLNDFFMYPFYLLQRLFLKTEWGSGFILKATKKE